MATIMASHMERNIIADSSQTWPGIRIHIMDIRQPPGMSIPPGMERQNSRVAARLKNRISPAQKWNFNEPKDPPGGGQQLANLKFCSVLNLTWGPLGQPHLKVFHP